MNFKWRNSISRTGPLEIRKDLLQSIATGLFKTISRAFLTWPLCFWVCIWERRWWWWRRVPMHIAKLSFIYCLKNFSDDDNKSLWRCLLIEFLYLSDRDFFLFLLFLLHALDVTRRGSFFWYSSSALIW